MKKAMSPRCAFMFSGMIKHNPAARSVQAMLGKVKSRRERRPQVSMVQTAGQAKMKLTNPKPKEARRACRLPAPAFLKTVEE